MKIAFFDLETLKLTDEVGGRTSEHLKMLGMSVGGVAINNGRVLVFEEHETQKLIDKLSGADVVVGHNLLGFDYYVLTPYTEKEEIDALRTRTVDTLQRLASLRNGFMRGLSLDILASLNFGIKKDLSGRLMPNLWKSGEKEKVIKHLMDDVKLTRKLFNHVEKNKKLKYEHFDYGESRGTQELKIPKGLFKLEGR